MPTSETPTPADQSHRNRGLFSDHYLNATLPEREGWHALRESARSAFERVSRVFESYVPSQNEAQTEQDLVRPILGLLGHDYEVQPALATPAGTKRPDYVFYKDPPALAANKGVTLDEDSLRERAFAVGDAKYWERPLDISGKGKGDVFTNKNPSYQISFYMQHTGTEWGILTNGRLWRLYHKGSAHRLDQYYEVDLEELVESDDVSRFLYFYGFFRREAFDDGPLGVRTMLAESTDYARSVGDSLETQVYEALRHLAQGFLDHPRNALEPDPETLQSIYDNALIVLYRLLFVLYAESRDLLPLRESEPYRETYSLYAIKHEAARGRKLLPTSATMWPRLRELFGIIAEGSPPLGVPAFDGGLFDGERHPFIERYTVGDGHLQSAVDALSRVDDQFVDYRDLSERHLGTIYEGLLEYHLEALSEPQDGWTVDLLNERGERHATGSYYTPDFVVRHIVDAAVGPMLHRAVEGAKTDEEKVAAVLALNVLDPSMGSGHFLVETTEYVARFLVELGVAPDEADSETELAYWKRRVAQSCVYGVDLNPLAVDLAKLSLWLSTVARDRPLSFLDHHLRHGNALLGADISNLMADTARKKRTKKPQVDEAQLSMASDPAFQTSIGTAVGSMWLIEENPADTLAEVREQENLYARLHEGLTRRYARLADLSTAAAFGVDVDFGYRQVLTDYALGRVTFVPPQVARWFELSDSLAREKSFFHWELEFPEVFFDRNGRRRDDGGGFDAVVGNPPYVRQEALGDLKPYLAAAYPETYHGVADLYVYFYQLGLRHLRRGGRMSYIVTNKWLRAGYGAPLRGFFAREGALQEIVDFGHAPIFPDADVFPCIIVLERPDRSDENGEVTVAEFPREALGKTAIGDFVRDRGYTVPRRRFGASAWSLEPPAVDDLMRKIQENGVPLAEFAGVKPLYGIKTGLNEAFLIDTPTRDALVREDPRSAEVIKPYLRGQDIKRWSPEWNGLWMILLKSSGDHNWPWTAAENAEVQFRRTYPALYGHMKPLEEKLRKRQDKGRNWWELRSCAYYDVFERQKIMYQVIQFHPQYGFDHRGMLSNDKTFFIPSDDGWLLTVLNSPLMWWHNWRYLGHMKDEALNPAGWRTERLSIAPPTDDARAEAEPAVERLVELSRGNREVVRIMLDWLRTEFGVEKPGGTLQDFAALDADAFVEEVRKRRPKSAGRLTPAALADLRAGYREQSSPVREGRIEARTLERRLSDLVNRAYGLTPEEIDLLWTTAPPRMPRF